MNSAIQASRLPEMIQAILAIEPSAPALEFEKHWHTWGELDATAQAVARALSVLQLGEGARIGTLMRNRPELVAVLIALFSSGHCLATLNAHAPDEALAADVERVQSPVIIGLAADLARPGMGDAIASSGAVALALTGDIANPVITHPVIAHPVTTASGLPSDRSSESNKAMASGIAIEMLTSGTTGAPKRIPLPYRNLEKALLGAAAYEKGRNASDAPELRSGVQIVSAPMAHIAGVTAVMNNILAGRRICLLDKFSVEGFRDAVVRHRPKVAGAPPSALRMILDANIPREDLSSLVAYRTGTAPLDPDLADAFYERYGIPVLQNYGATEFAGGAAGWTLDDFKTFWKLKRGSVGRINPGLEARVVDAQSGKILSRGSEGLLEMRGANIGDGETFVRTTDLAILDEDGFLFIKGRHDGAIIRGGFKILPQDLIKALEQHPAIREAGVVGLTDARLGQVPAAAYILKSSAAAPSEDELKLFLRERLMPYQIPVRIMVLTDFPRTPSLKISQPALKALFESEG